MIRKSLFFVALVATVAMAPATEAREDHITMDAAELLEVSYAFGVPCQICDVCTGDGHVAPNSEWGMRTSEVGAHTDCSPVSGCDQHPLNCDPDEEDFDLAAAWVLVTSDEAATLKGVVARSAGKVWVNEARRSLQVAGCAGGVIANIPLSNSTLAALLE